MFPGSFGLGLVRPEESVVSSDACLGRESSQLSDV